MAKKNKLMIVSVFIIMIAAIVGIAGYYWYEGAVYIHTEDAKVTGDTANASALLSAKITELDVKAGDIVEKDDIIARQDMKGLDVSRIESSIVRAPIGGVVLKTSGTVDETVAAGAVLAILVDPANLYITANVEETKLQKVKPGQTVDISIDEYKGVKFMGTVTEIGQATAASFSLLPQSSSGTFTKIVQTIPVKIAIENGDRQLHPGTNAAVKIHVK